MIAKRKSRRVRRNAPLSATERRSLKSILRKHRSNPGTRAKTKLWGNSPIPGGRLGDVARDLVDPSRYAFKPHGKWDYVLVKFANADALRREIEEDGARCPAHMGGGSRGMGKAAVGWKPATLWLRDGARSNPNARKRKVAARRYFQHKSDMAKKVSHAAAISKRRSSFERITAATRSYAPLSRVGGAFVKRGKDKHMIDAYGWYLEEKSLPKRAKHRASCSNPKMLDHECIKSVQHLKGEYVKRKPDSEKVYLVEGYDPVYKRWQLTDCSNAGGNGLQVRSGTKLFAGFTY